MLRQEAKRAQDKLEQAQCSLEGLRAQVARLETDNRNLSMVSKDRYWKLRQYEEAGHAFQQRLIDEMVGLHLRIVDIIRTLSTMGVDGRRILGSMYQKPDHTDTAGVKSDG
jgi:hypothetical protein